ncbi:hypothetical protein DLAC_01665 [Tieghemostelium lacteum]|uniref:Uncharacterized protein n=1 Tax=Tieghemostelium lacteum TaxID=361077 RepID=A0A152A616_TIELA|nr:hypothetical protein DLAC_01665 [Tieghemostelium lacteum]|eukprot:KYR01663.1 hypothetical protein DLAC_01665 [Tieghemostelium lacteum]
MDTLDIVQYSESFNEIELQYGRYNFNQARYDYMLMSKFLKWFDEYQPNCHNQQHSRVVKVLNAFPDVMMLYRKSIYQKLLESKDSTIIEILFRLPPLNESTLPLSSLLDASNYANVTRNWYNMATSMIMQIYSIGRNREEIEKDFTTRSDLIREKKFSFQTIRETIQIFLKGVIVTHSEENSEKLIFYLCLLTFQNLTRDDILELKDDYMKLIPHVYKYSSSSRIKSISFTGLDRKSERIESNLSIAKRYSHRVQSQQPNYLYYLIQYYGMDIIEKESEIFYLDWKSKPKDHSEYTTLFTFAQYMIDSQYIRDNLQVLYNYFWLAIESNFGNYIYYLNIWGNYIERYGIVQPKYFDNLRDFLIDKRKIIITNSLHPTLYEFYNSLLSANTQYTISNFKQIVTEYANKPYNFMVYLNQLLMKPTILQAIKTSDNSKQLYKEIKDVGSMSPVHYCYLLEFFMAYKKVYEYPKMIPKFIDAINSNKKWLIKDESFFAPILRFYSLIKIKNPNEANQLFEKTIRSFIKVLESCKNSTVKLDIIYPYLNDINEITYLFKLTKQILNDSDQYIEIFKHFIDLDQIDQKYIQENLDAVVEMGFKYNNYNHISRTLKILDGLNRYTNLDSQILKLTNQFLRWSGNATIISNLLSSLLDISSGYEGFVDSLLSIYFSTINISHVVYYINTFDSIHQKVFYKNSSPIDIFQQDIIRIHNQLVRGIINKWNLVDLPLQSIQIILMYFKPLKSLETLLQDKILKQFKSFDITSKKCILRYIKKNEIRVLEYLNDFNLTGFTFDHYKIEQNINNQTPYVQNLIIQKFVSFIARDKSTKPSDNLLLSLVSKLFFKSVCLTFQHYKIKLPQKLPDKYQLSRGMWSFMSLGCYHLNYKDLERFHYQDVEDIFYQISSLTIQNPMTYLVEREMSNLTHLKIEIRFEMSLSCILQMVEHCFKLQSFQLSVSSIPLNSIIITLIDNIIQKLITNNTSTLNQLNFGYSVFYITSVDLIEPMEAIFEQITNHQISNPTTFKNQISLNFITDNSYERVNFPNLVSIRSLTTSCTHLILQNYYDNILNQLKPNLFLNLRSIFIQIDYQLSLDIAHFIMSPEIELESLTILCYPNLNTIDYQRVSHQILEVLKKPKLQKVKIILYAEQLLPEHINPIFSVANQNHTIKSIKIYKYGFNKHVSGHFKNYYEVYKSPCVSDDHQFTFGDFHPINNYHFIKY